MDFLVTFDRFPQISSMNSMDFLVNSIDVLAQFNGFPFKITKFLRQIDGIWAKKPSQNHQGRQDLQRIRDLQGNVKTLEQ